MLIMNINETDPVCWLVDRHGGRSTSGHNVVQWDIIRCLLCTFS